MADRTDWKRVFSASIPIVAAILGGVTGALVTWSCQPDPIDWELVAREHGWVERAEWHDMARHEGWILKTDCPAYPLELHLVNPGNGVSVGMAPLDNSAILNADLIVTTKRSVPDATSVGIVVHETEGTNHYLVFPEWDETNNRRSFKKNQPVILPFEPEYGGQLSIWAIAVNERERFGVSYGSLEQIEDIMEGTVLSDKVTVSLRIP
jgi:hypothetical protein